jgi:purine catabolism regulator
VPVIEVPYEVPFIAVDRYVADRVLHSQYQRQHDLLTRHDTLSRALLSGGGLTSLADALRLMLDAPVAVLDAFGAALASSPAGAAWPPLVDDDSDLVMAPIQIGGADVATLCALSPREGRDVLPYAASLVGLELARRQAQLAGRRELLGQVIEDVAASTISLSEAQRRLAAHGIDVTRPHAVVLASAPPGAAARLRALPGGVYPMSDSGVEPVVTAHAGDHLALIVGREREVRDVAQLTYKYVAQLGDGARVGIGGSYEGVNGLRWSYHEAREACSRGAGVNDREPLSLPGLLLSSDSLPLADLGREVLAPLHSVDTAAGSALVETLRAYLEEDASVARAAQRLFVHRNTVRYRLEQIERLTGRSLESTQDRVQLWLALQVVELSK